MRTAILVVVLLSIAALAALTIAEIAKHGFDILTAVSLLIIALFAFGIVGALREPPPDP